MLGNLSGLATECQKDLNFDNWLQILNNLLAIIRENLKIYSIILSKSCPLCMHSWVNLNQTAWT